MGNLDSAPLVEHLFRHQAGRIVARLTRLLGPACVGLAEDVVQEAMLRALRTWPYDGIPDNPAGWLYRVAHNLAIDAVRRAHSFGDKTEAIVADLTQSGETALPDETAPDDQLRDDELRMIFMCCHPQIARDASVALSLKTVGGFSVREIARAFLADETAIAQRIVRAKKQIRDRRLTLDLPSGRALGERIDAVLDVIYFMFNEGYTAHDGADLIRRDLCMEAIRLARLVADTTLATPKSHALVALMALQAARFRARVDAAGDLVLLDDQDRALWDERLIATGFAYFDRSLNGPDVSAYHVQAAIAATHARAITPERLDWPLILELYDELLAIDPSPVVALNRAVAVARVRGASEALAAVERLARDPKLRHYHLLMSVRGQLLADVGRTEEAARSFQAALDCENVSEPERRFLQKKLEACASSA
ncbi:MAG TPA: sigma-70 family RNA polymerase sigma factor [Vicinamibacterales bacterium]